MGQLPPVIFESIYFSVASSAAWAPHIETRDEWLAWAFDDRLIAGRSTPSIRPMPSILRRRAGFLGKMALEVAYQCLGARTDVPTVFSSRHGEASRSADLLLDLARGLPLSPTSFSLSVHNAAGGLFSIARGDGAPNMALVAGTSSVEHAVIEAYGLISEGAPAVLLVVYDCPLPALCSEFEDCHEQPYAWAWLMEPAADEVLSLQWEAGSDVCPPRSKQTAPGLEVLRFYLRKDSALQRVCNERRWLWSR
ncbi:MAG TPA: beta-ketoacyl synthase chain length factor, partial [Candidatus Nitrosocosmicus sp.]|nr:beta-ketoacyl synthase chain length factor [Candidatus Nitrosocosmicus sp.]